MELLIIPAVLAIGAFYLNRTEREVERKSAENRADLERKAAEDRAKVERELATDRQQEAALQAYLDRMADLLLSNSFVLGEEAPRNVARIRTLTVLRGLDARRKGLVIQFLSEAALIQGSQPVISLEGADLRGADLRTENLKEANFNSALLEDAKLNYADLGGAFLEAMLNRADLLGANLKDAKLAGAFLNDADLELANLRGADLQAAALVGANLKKADLTGSNLRNTFLSQEQLATVRSLKGATLSDGTKQE
jgi:uncharacterized protein YjbI with pentapeptide repeats